jgi:hypothetical protein
MRTSSSHEEEGNKLQLLDLRFIGILRGARQAMRTPSLRITDLEDLENITVSDQVHGNGFCTTLLHGG